MDNARQVFRLLLLPFRISVRRSAALWLSFLHFICSHNHFPVTNEPLHFLFSCEGFFFFFVPIICLAQKKKKKNPRGEYGQLPPMLHVFEFAAVPRWLKPPAAKRGAACSISGLGGCIYGWAKKCCCKRRFVVIYCCYPNGCFQLICSPPLQIVPHNKGALTVLLR